MRIFLLVTLATLAFSAAAQEANGVGYPTVDAALAALKSKSGVNISVQGGWTIVDDRQSNAIWSFTPADHPAHPAVVKRSLVQKDSGVYIDMTALCQATKAACDKLMDEFNALNARVAQSMKSKPGAFQGSPEQQQAVEKQTLSYFAARDGRQYDSAYRMLSETQKAQISFENWRGLAEDFNNKAGQVRGRTIVKTTWYKDPPQARPGVYAAVDFSSQFENVNIHCGYVVWSLQEDGSFLLIREEQNYIDKLTEQKIKPEDLARLRAQFRCRD